MEFESRFFCTYMGPKKPGVTPTLVSIFPDKFPLLAQHSPRPSDQVEECELQRDGKSQVRRL